MRGLYPPPPGHLWLLIDVDNSNGDGVKNYGWFFLSRGEAREHMKKQNADPNKAQLVGPYRYDLVAR